MGHSRQTSRHKNSIWVRAAIRTATGGAALAGLMVLMAGQASAALEIQVTVNSDFNRADHLEGVTYPMGVPGLPLATFTDSNACASACSPASVYTASIQWGDSGPNTDCPSSDCTIVFVSQSTTTGSYSITANHAYADEFNCPGNTCGFPIHVQVTDNNDAVTSGGTGTIAVQDQPFLTDSLSQSFSATVNAPFTGNIGTMHDGNQLASPLDQGGTMPEYSISIDWGDGTALDTTSGGTAIGNCGSDPGTGVGQGCEVGVSGSHTYASTGVFTTTVTVSDGADPHSLVFHSTANVGAATCAGNAGGSDLYTLDGYGGVHPDGGANSASGYAYWKGWDIARGIALMQDGSGGYTMDAFGGLHPFKIGSCALPATVHSSYWAGQNLARGLAIAPWATAAAPAGYLLDAYGGVHPFGNAPAVPSSSYWKGWDIARGIVILPDSTPTSVGGYVLDGWGGLHPFGNAPKINGAAYWAGRDIARGITLLPTATHAAPRGYTLDGQGGVHPFGGAPSVKLTGYWTTDVARAVLVLPSSSNTAAGGYVMDLYGGIHPFGIAPLVNGYPYWSGMDIARGIGSDGEGSAVRKV